MTSYNFEIPGVAAPQGSKKYVGKSKKTGAAVLVEQSTKVKPWRAHVVAFIAKLELEQLRGAIGIDVTFYFTRPRTSTALYPSAGGPGDVDKLLRSTFDAFTTSGIWEDDARVCKLASEKLWAPFGAPPHAVIRVWELQA